MERCAQRRDNTPTCGNSVHGSGASSRALVSGRGPGCCGGVAPGSSWKDDGTSWTPETALLALAYAGSGRPADARRILRWLAEHRTAAGSLPEKVLHDGRPAAVAPLGWTASLVLLTLARLEHGKG